jgi:hemerythrin
MSAVNWDESLSVGVEVIDEQHKALIQKLNDTSAAVATGEGERQTAQALEFLIEYTEYHFSTEERHMEKVRYPGMVAHKALHAEFKQTLSELEQDFREEGATKKLADAVHTLLMTWLVKHIQNVDQNFAVFLEACDETVAWEV